MKHLRKTLPAIVLAAAVIISLCVITFSSPNEKEPHNLDVSIAAASPEKQKPEKESQPETKPVTDEKTTPVKDEKKAEAPKATSSTSILAAGVVKEDVNLRKDASTSSEILTTLSGGTTVSILGEKDGWYQVSYDGKKGYMSSEFVTSKTSASDLSGYAKVTADLLNMRATPDAGGEIVAMIEQNEYVSVIGFENGWYKVSYDDCEGYMSGDYLSLVAEKPQSKPAASSGSSSGSSASSLPSGQSAGTGSGSGSTIVDYALSFCGVPYVYGGASPSGFDCSGFTMYVYSHFGYSLPHGATSQLYYGSEVSMSNMVPGDLVFFFDSNYASSGASHVGIYIGGGQFVHASSGPGYCVKVSSFYGDGDTGNYYSNVFLTARHIAN